MVRRRPRRRSPTSSARSRSTRADQFLTWIVTGAEVPVRVCESVPLTVRTWLPLDTARVSHATETGPRLFVTVRPRSAPSTNRMKVLLALLVDPSIHTVVHPVPGTVASRLGAVIETVTLPLPGDDVGGGEGAGGDGAGPGCDVEMRRPTARNVPGLCPLPTSASM